MGFLDKIMDTMHLGGDYDDDYDDYDDDDYEEDRPKKGIFKKKEKEFDYDMEDDVVTESGKVRPIKQQSRITPMRSRKTVMLRYSSTPLWLRQISSICFLASAFWA